MSEDTPLADALLRRIDGCEENDWVYRASGALARRTFYHEPVSDEDRVLVERLLREVSE